MRMCDYGCGQEAHFIMSSGKWCCSDNYNKCLVKRKNSSKSKLYVPDIYTGDDLCDYGCGSRATYIHKNGKKSCKKKIQKCNGVIQLMTEMRCIVLPPDIYNGNELCYYGCGKVAGFKFQNDMLCCSDNISKCYAIHSKKIDTLKRNYGDDVFNPMNVCEVRNRQNLARDRTILERYGVTNPILIDGMKEKLEKIFLDRYNVKSPLELANKKKIEQHRWLDYVGIPLENREHRIELDDGIGGGWIIADGIDPVSNTVYEFWGDLWHGNLDIYDSNFIHPFNGKTMEELNEETNIKRQRIVNAGYTLVEIWEDKWLHMRKGDNNGSKNADGTV